MPVGIVSFFRTERVWLHPRARNPGGVLRAPAPFESAGEAGIRCALLSRRGSTGLYAAEVERIKAKRIRQKNKHSTLVAYPGWQEYPE